MLAVTDYLIGIALAVFYHLTNHGTCLWTMAIIEILAHHFAITIDGALVLIEHDTLFVAYCSGYVGNIFEIVKASVYASPILLVRLIQCLFHTMRKVTLESL